ncbi:DUF6265 family protein [Pseudoxanthomonas wuyuanensis]|uniref:DUF6265 domain-containing protein n=1 Tax=Pseudoxanthomonas wuyuanensis TaxID=1073196 RepID=A0A286D3R8_9GAMM|nr:DUF6265 family protein [Pseudoxanthomonas wuyuanensis]KAF1722921.1 hypothetical protein CSC75_00045 [Pseudoxanthomonas wuyuanensis]SOD53277.1 hypothetical protein SAMN06296416_102328 [Pseudoxanthomonas wuyuanensis]
MKRTIVAGLAACFLLASPLAGAEELAWLAGHWCGVQGKTFSEETWMAPRGDLLLGMHRDTRDGRAAGFEFMRIARQDGRWVFLAQPNGKDAVAFPVDSAAADRIVFANPAHDFPRRVIYRRVDADTLHARVDDGSDAGQKLEWTWTRDCEAGAPAEDSSKPAR